MPYTPKPIAAHGLLILPFTWAALSDPSPLLPTIFRAVHLADHSLTVLFATPAPPQSASSLTSPAGGGSVYAEIRQQPVVHWESFQRFLGAVYAILAAAQWGVERVLMDVEVRFEGEDGDWRDKLIAVPDVVLLPKDMSLPPCLGDISLPTPHPISNPIPTSHSPPDSHPTSTSSTPSPSPRPVVALGGTFDHLHAAHKLLLHLSLFLTGRKLIVGVMCDRLLKSKSNAQLVQPIEERIAITRAFLKRCGVVEKEVREEGRGKEKREGVWGDVVEIEDPLGPTAWDADIQALVVSKETLSGGHGVNSARAKSGLPQLELFVIDVISANLAIAAAQSGTLDSNSAGTPHTAPEPGTGSDRVLRPRKASAGGGVSVGVRFNENVDVEMISPEPSEGWTEGEGIKGLGLGTDGDEEGVESMRTVDLAGEEDEKKLKEMKMGSTAIRQWIVDRRSEA